MAPPADRSLPHPDKPGRLWSKLPPDTLRAGVVFPLHCRWCNRPQSHDKRGLTVCLNCDDPRGYLTGQKPE